MFVHNSRRDRVINLSGVRELRDEGDARLHGARKYTVIYHNGADEVFHAYPHTVETALRTLIPAASGEVLIVVRGGVDQGEVWVETDKYQIIAWAFEPGSSLPEAVTATDGIIQPDDNKLVGVLRPDGKIEAPLDCVWDDVDAMITDLKAQLSAKNAA